MESQRLQSKCASLEKQVQVLSEQIEKQKLNESQLKQQNQV